MGPVWTALRGGLPEILPGVPTFPGVRLALHADQRAESVSGAELAGEPRLELPEKLGLEADVDARSAGVRQRRQREVRETVAGTGGLPREEDDPLPQKGGPGSGAAQIVDDPQFVGVEGGGNPCS